MNQAFNQRLVRSQSARFVLATAGAALLAFGPASFGQAQSPGDQLKGPAVTENRAPGAEGNFGAGGPGFKNNKGGREGAGREMMRAYHQAFGAVLGEDAPENVRASDAQREQIEKIFRDFGAEARSYMQQHKDELQAMRPKRGDAEQGENAEATRKANRDKVEAIMQGAPKPKDAFNKAWAVLNPQQQAAVKARLDKAEERMSERREDDYVRRHMNRGKEAGRGAPERDGPKGPKGPDARRRGAEGAFGARPGGGPGAGSPERRERLMQLFNRLTPEQQEQLLRRLEERRAGGGPDQPGRPGREGRGQRKAPPPMDDLDVPPPPPPAMHDEPMNESPSRD